MIIFQSARLKLTLWYVLISFVISLFFSIAIFFLLDLSLEASYQRVARRFDDRPLPPDYVERILIQRREIDQIEKQTRLNLIYVNLFILAVSGSAGYFLAGRALKPIISMVSEQNNFIANASHEIRTPLTALKTEIEVSLRDKNLNLIKTKEILKENLKDVDSLKRLTDSLLSITQISEDDIKVGFKPVLLSEIIKNAVDKFQLMAKKKNIAFNVYSDDSVIFGDREHLTELLIIFLDNAIKYGKKNGTVTINSKENNKQVLIKIEDNGKGIGKEDLPYIFDRFYRSDKSRSKNDVSGYGLGLSIAKQIIDAHRGFVHTQSTLGKGTIFTIKLPVKP